MYNLLEISENINR